MDPDLKLALNRFIAELKKDIWFFGACGIVVGLFMVWQARLKELGVLQNPKWATDLFSDFMSFNAFSLIFFGYLLLGCVATIFSDLGRQKPCLEAAVSHMEVRLAQIASAIVSFLTGLLALVTLYSILNLDSGGVTLLALALVFSFLIVAGFTVAFLVGRRTKPFDKWWVALLCSISISVTLGWLLLQGGK